MTYFFLFLNGIAAFISPCLLPMLPLYISYFSACEEDGERSLLRTLFNSLLFILGFTLVFIALGVGASALGIFMRRYDTVLNIIGGLILIIFGLHYVGAFRLDFLNRTFKINYKFKKISLFSSFIFGIVFSVGWTPCVGILLGSALTLASQSQSMLRGAVMLLVYSAGLGIPFILSALFLNVLKNVSKFIKKHYRIMNIVSGVLLIIIGLLTATGLISYYFKLFL